MCEIIDYVYNILIFWRNYLCKSVPTIIIETYIGSNGMFGSQKYYNKNNIKKLL